MGESGGRDPGRSRVAGPGRSWGWPGPGRRAGDAWPLLESLAEREREDLLALARPRVFAADDVVCLEGDPADSMHLVAEGRFGVRVSLPSGDTGMVNLLGPGDYFGELALLRRDGRRTATVTALEPGRTLVVTETDFRRLCEEHPDVHRTLAVLLAGRVDALSRSVLELMHVGLDQRVHRRLYELALSETIRRDGDRAHPRTPAGTTVVVPLTQAQVAELTGGTRPSVNKALRALVGDGIVSLGRGRIEVHDLEALRRRCRLDAS